MKNWRVELTAGGKSLAEVKVERSTFQRDVLLPLLFVISMMPLNHIFRKWKGKLCKSQEKINHLMYADDIKPFVKNENQLETLIQTVKIYNQDIGMEFEIEKCALLIMRSRKHHMMEGIEWLNQENQNSWRKGNLQILEKRTQSNKWRWKKK